MKFTAATITGLLLSLILAGTTAATPNKTTPINATLVGNGCGIAGTECAVSGGGSCLCIAYSWSFTGRGRIAPLLGTFTFRGEYGEGHFPTDPVDDIFSYSGSFTYYRELTLTLTTPNGDSLVLYGRTSAQTPLGPGLSVGNTVSDSWTVNEASGRLARLSGSGTYTLSDESHFTYETFFLGLTGSLTFQ